MAQGAIRSPIDINVQERKVAILLRLHGKLNSSMKAIHNGKGIPPAFLVRVAQMTKVSST